MVYLCDSLINSLMKKTKFVVIYLITLVLLCSTVKAAESIEDIEIKDITILEKEKEAHIAIANLPRPVGFEVFLNGIDVTEGCRIRFGTELLAIDCLLIVQLPREYLNTTNILYIHFYDEIDSIEFTETFDFSTSELSKINWWLVLGVIVGLIAFNMLGGALMSRKGKKIDNVTMNPLTKLPTYKEMTIKTVIALIVSIGLFVYTAINPYYYYPQLIDHNWGFAYDFLDYFSMGGFLIAIIGLSHHLFLLALGSHRKTSSNPNKKSISSFNYYIRRIIGGTDEDGGTLNKERNSSFVVISKTALILTMVFALRILMLLLVSTLYEYSPQKFMLVLSSETVSAHSILETLRILLQALSTIFLICAALGLTVSIYLLYKVIFKRKETEKDEKKVYIVIKILLPLFFFGFYQACVILSNIITLTG